MEAPRTMPGRAGGVASVVGQIQAERLRFALMRISFVGLSLLYALLLVWAVPWIPVGMTRGNYDTATVMLLGLALLPFVSSLLFLIIWTPQFRNESLPEFLRVLFGARQLIRGRQQFQSRLAAECQRARKDRRRIFSLVVIQVPGSSREEREKRDGARLLAAMLVRDCVRGEDVVADSWPHEVWVLAVGAPAEARPHIIRRLARALATSDTPVDSIDCKVGGSTFDLDGQDPDGLFSAAYQRLAPLPDLLEEARAA